MTTKPMARPDLPAQDSLQELHVFGQKLRICHDGNRAEALARRADLQQIYEPFLASRVIPRTGLMVDIGAGAGWVGAAFAKAFPDWQVWCFEPDAAAFAALEDTVRQNDLANVTCIRAGFHPDAAPAPGLAPRRAGQTDMPDAIRAACTAPAEAGYRRLSGLGHRIAPDDTVQGGDILSAPALSPDLLTALAPDLVKIDAPGVEADLARALRSVPTGFVTGKLHQYVPSTLWRPEDPAQPRELYLPLGKHVLRWDYEDGFASRRPGLDVVVAMYNTRDYIRDCVDSLLADGNPEITVLVVDDGSTDGSDEIVRDLYGDNPRVRLLQKANGGCASARNFGRAQSHSAHITFVDADDRVDRALFTSLLDVARYTGWNMVEGEFSPFEVTETGREKRLPTYEAKLYADGPDSRLGDITYRSVSGIDLIYGQPTIWRRVYRRDFLDSKAISFPEHVRAFDDQIFQLLSAYYSGPVAHVFGHAYQYRQHPGQDIKQGDERHFYSFNMFRQVFQRAQKEAWKNLTPVVESLLNTMAWSYGGLRDDLKPIYQEAAVEFLAILAKTYGPHLLERADPTRTGIDGIDSLLELRLHALRDQPVDYAMMRVENWRWQPEFIRMMRAGGGAA